MPAYFRSFSSVRHPNLKSLALLMGLAILVALAGCGGGSDSSSTTGGETTAPVGKSEATTKSSPSQKQKAAKKGKEQKKQKPKVDRKQVEKEIRELANSGKPIPADSPVAKKIIQSLTGNGGSGKKGKNSITKTIEEVVSPPQGGGGGSSGGGQGNAPSAGVEKILEQIQK